MKEKVKNVIESLIITALILFSMGLFVRMIATLNAFGIKWY